MAAEKIQQLHEEIARLRRRVEELEAAPVHRAAAEGPLDDDCFLLALLLNYLPDSIYFKDRESRFLRINRALALRFGLSDPRDAIGKTDADFFTEEHAQQALADERELVRSGRPLMYKEERETWPNGGITWVATTKLPLRDRQGNVVGTFGISRDITDRKRGEEALREAMAAVESVSRAKSEFLANMSHEIRTPMNAVIGMTELVLGTDLSAEQREYLTMVLESGEALLSIINDILDFSKVEAGKLELEKAPFSLRECLGDTMKSLALRAHDKGLELACDIHHHTPDALIGDPHRLRQIVVNLVGNAIKFTEHGEVVMTVGPHPTAQAGENKVTLRFTISDTGIGIPPGKLRAIFAAFEQADSSVTRKYGGTGLGLAISSRLVGLMGGSISVESEVGCGSTFEFLATFEAAGEGRTLPPPEKRVIVRGTPVLVVDDNETNRRILDEMLTNWGMRPTTAADVPQALRLLSEAERDGRPFRLVLTDCNMPVRDGFSLVEEIKREECHRSTVIMMLTSGDQPGNISRCEAMGVSAYLMKPVKQSELFDAISLALGVTATEEEGDYITSADVGPLGPLRILLAEDSLVNQKLALGLLERHGHRVFVANNGKEAVAAYGAHPFDLILMDVQMPEMDGLEATRAIRQMEKKSGVHVPIAAMTAHAMRGDRERCLEAGMDDYIAKPVRSKVLFETVARLLGQGDATPAEAASSGAGPASAIDWKEALAAVGGDRELLQELVEAFLTESPQLLAGIEQAMQENDSRELQRQAHSLKGSMKFFGAQSGAEAAWRLEELGQSGDLSRAPERLLILQQELKELQAELASGVPQ